MTDDQIRSKFTRALANKRVYLANHSLGRPLDQMATDVAEGLGFWYDGLDEAWGPWIKESETWQEKISDLIGWHGGEWVVPKTSVGQGLRAVLNSMSDRWPLRVLATKGEFDSVDFILKAYEQKGAIVVDWIHPTLHEGMPVFETGHFLDRIGFDTHMVIVSAVFYATGQVMSGLDAVAASCRRNGATLVVDVYHAVGVVPATYGYADVVLGGSYKYLRGGPGACFMAITPEFARQNKTLDTGWFAKADTFGFERSDVAHYAEGGKGWHESTPPALIPYQARSGLQFTLDIGVEALRKDSMEKQAYLREKFCQAGVIAFQPERPERFGAFTIVPCDAATELAQRLTDLGITVDSRQKRVRFTPDILTTYAELDLAAQATAKALRSLY